MSGVTRTITIEQAAPEVHRLHLNRDEFKTVRIRQAVLLTLDERQAEMMSDLENCPLFNEEQKEALRQAKPRLGGHAAFSLASIMVGTIDAAILEKGEDDAALEILFYHKDKLMEILKERLPSGIDAEKFIEEIAKTLNRIEEGKVNLPCIYDRISGLAATASSINEEIFTKGDALTDQINARDQKTRAGYTALLNSKLAISTSITQETAPLLAKLENTAKNAAEIGKKTTALTQQVNENGRQLTALADKAYPIMTKKGSS
jgi:hypothetical protein